MANDVCESWEDILKEESLDKKVNNLKLNVSDKTNGSVSSSIRAEETTQCNGNSLKILKRNKKPTKQVIDLDSLMAMCSNQNINSMAIGNSNNNSVSLSKSSSDLSNYVHSEPFVPQSNRNVQISFEDNTRTQFLINNADPKLPKVKILQRPKVDSIMTQSSQNNLSKNGNATLKSFQEREAEYAKARLRILGSAVPNYEDKELKPSTSPVNNGGSSPNREEVLTRQPHGPTSSNTRGFTAKR